MKKKVLETLGNSITKENNKQKKLEYIPTNKKNNKIKNRINTFKEKFRRKKGIKRKK